MWTLTRPSEISKTLRICWPSCKSMDWSSSWTLFLIIHLISTTGSRNRLIGKILTLITMFGLMVRPATLQLTGYRQVLHSKSYHGMHFFTERHLFYLEIGFQWLHVGIPSQERSILSPSVLQGTTRFEFEEPKSGWRAEERAQILDGLGCRRIPHWCRTSFLWRYWKRIDLVLGGQILPSNLNFRWTVLERTRTYRSEWRLRRRWEKIYLQFARMFGPSSRIPPSLGRWDGRRWNQA